MASRPSVPINLTSKASSSRSIFIVPFKSSLLSAFNRIINLKRFAKDAPLRDKCYCPKLTYNSNYNPYKKPRLDLFSGYTLYVFPKPLWDNRATIVARFPKNYTLAKPSKKPRI